MKAFTLMLLLLLSVFAFTASAEPKNMSCQHSVGPPDNWCPRCSQFPNYLLARRVDPVEGPCLLCYLGCALTTASPENGSSAAGSEEADVCPRQPELTAAELERDSLVSLRISAEELQQMARQYPIAASMIAVLHANGDPLPVLDRLNEFQIQFRDRPVAQSASDYFRQSYPAAREDLPDDSDVLTTAKSSHIDADTVLLEIQSELRSAKGTDLVIEGPVFVELRNTGERGDFNYGGVTLHPLVMVVGDVSSAAVAD